MARSIYINDHTSLSHLSAPDWSAVRGASHVVKLGDRRWSVGPTFGNLVFQTRGAAVDHVYWAIRAETRYRNANA